MQPQSHVTAGHPVAAATLNHPKQLEPAWPAVVATILFILMVSLLAFQTSCFHHTHGTPENHVRAESQPYRSKSQPCLWIIHWTRSSPPFSVPIRQTVSNPSSTALSQGPHALLVSAIKFIKSPNFGILTPQFFLSGDKEPRKPDRGLVLLSPPRKLPSLY